MRKRLKYLWWALFSFFVLALAEPHNVALAQVKPLDTPTEKLHIRYPDYQKLKDLRTAREFKYAQDVRPGRTFWQRFWFKIRQLLSRVTSAKAYNGFGKYVFYVMAMAIGVYAVLQVLRVDLIKLFGRQAATVPLPYTLHAENIHEINFNALIAEAENQGDYRRAVRLHYLSILKSLSDKDLISWSPAKTNQSYLSEIKAPHIRHAFGQITQLFEYVWYGGANLPESDFKNIRATLQGLHHTINVRP